MHIGFYSPSWPPGPHPNGIVTYVQAMRRELIAQGHRVSIISQAVEEDAEEGVYGVASGGIPRLRRVGKRLLGQHATVFDLGDAIASTIRRVHLSDPLNVIEMEESFGWASQVASGTRIPLVVKLHGPAFLTMSEEELDSPFGAAKVAREGEALKMLPVIVSPSRCTLIDTAARYQLSPQIAETLVNPLFAADDLPLWNSATSRPDKILYVGRFDKVKGADVLIQAFQRVLQVRPDARLEFIGPDIGLGRPGNGRIHLTEFVASLGDPALKRSLACRGSLLPDEISALRPTAALTVIASRRENQPYSALEAMLQACPVVCTDTSGLSELIQHGVTGLKAKPEDPSDLAAQMQRVMDDPALGRSLGLAAREYVLTHHSPATVVRRALAIYGHAIELHATSAAAKKD